MAALFAISTLAQFDDPDWYFWIPLYAAACLVNLANGVSKYKKMRQIAKFALLFGLFLLIKLFIQDFVQGIAGFLSLDMREKVVGGKIGSGIVIISMFLQLQASSEPYKVNKATGSNNVRVGTYVKYGMALLVGIGYGTAFVFLMFYKGEMKN